MWWLFLSNLIFEKFDVIVAPHISISFSFSASTQDHASISFILGWNPFCPLGHDHSLNELFLYSQIAKIAIFGAVIGPSSSIYRKSRIFKIAIFSRSKVAKNFALWGSTYFEGAEFKYAIGSLWSAAVLVLWPNRENRENRDFWGCVRARPKSRSRLILEFHGG